jgi:Protein of unknown function (DUF3627)
MFGLKHRLQELSAENAATDIPMLSRFKFTGKSQNLTPVVTAQGIVELLYLIPGRKAQSFRRYCGEILIRFMGGDQTLIDEINVNAVIANVEGTAQSFFYECVKSIPTESRQTFDLKHYAAKLELDFLFKEKEVELHSKELELRTKEMDLCLRTDRKRHLLKVEIDEHEILILAKRAKIDILQLEAVKQDISYRPQRNELLPKITILVKNETLPPGSQTKKYEKMPFLILRCQERTMDKTMAKATQKFPNMKIILDRIYHFNIIGNESVDEKTERIKAIYDKLTQFNIGHQSIVSCIT